jgi:hypothetical protein
MKQEILERMLMDRSLGVLSPDVDALLSAYLENEPSRAMQAADIEESVALARQLLAKPPAVWLPPLKIAPLTSRATNEALPSRQMWWVGLAASFVLGLSLAALTLNTDSVESPKTLASVEPATPVSTVSSDERAASGFWSVKRLAALDSKRPAANPQRPSWPNPIRRSQPGH